MSEEQNKLSVTKKICARLLKSTSPGSRTPEQIRSIMEYLSKCGALPAAMDEEEILADLCQGVKFLQVDENALIFIQGQPGHLYYVIFSGAVDIQQTRDPSLVHELLHKYAEKLNQTLGPEFDRSKLGSHLCRLSQNKGFGEGCLLKEGTMRAASALTCQPTELLEIESALFSRTFKIYHGTENNTVMEEVFELIRSLALCKGLPGRVLTQIAFQTKTFGCSLRSKICSEGDQIEKVILIREGEVRETKMKKDVQIEVSTHGNGFYIGALDLLKGKSRFTHGYQAVTNIQGYAISLEGFSLIAGNVESVQTFLELEAAREQLHKKTALTKQTSTVTHLAKGGLRQIASAFQRTDSESVTGASTKSPPHHSKSMTRGMSKYLVRETEIPQPEPGTARTARDQSFVGAEQVNESRDEKVERAISSIKSPFLLNQSSITLNNPFKIHSGMSLFRDKQNKKGESDVTGTETNTGLSVSAKVYAEANPEKSARSKNCLRVKEPQVDNSLDQSSSKTSKAKVLLEAGSMHRRASQMVVAQHIASLHEIVHENQNVRKDSQKKRLSCDMMCRLPSCDEGGQESVSAHGSGHAYSSHSYNLKQSSSTACSENVPVPEEKSPNQIRAQVQSSERVDKGGQKSNSHTLAISKPVCIAQPALLPGFHPNGHSVRRSSRATSSHISRGNQSPGSEPRTSRACSSEGTKGHHRSPGSQRSNLQFNTESIVYKPEKESTGFCHQYPFSQRSSNLPSEKIEPVHQKCSPLKNTKGSGSILKQSNLQSHSPKVARAVLQPGMQGVNDENQDTLQGALKSANRSDRPQLFVSNSQGYPSASQAQENCSHSNKPRRTSVVDIGFSNTDQNCSHQALDNSGRQRKASVIDLGLPVNNKSFVKASHVQGDPKLQPDTTGRCSPSRKSINSNHQSKYKLDEAIPIQRRRHVSDHDPNDTQNSHSPQVSQTPKSPKSRSRSRHLSHQSKDKRRSSTWDYYRSFAEADFLEPCS